MHSIRTAISNGTPSGCVRGEYREDDSIDGQPYVFMWSQREKSDGRSRIKVDGGTTGTTSPDLSRPLPSRVASLRFARVIFLLDEIENIFSEEFAFDRYLYG